jgi:hypothetical protein
VFVSQLADRVVANNDLNRDLLARLVEEKIIDPRPVPELRVRDLDKLAGRLTGDGSIPGADHASPPPPR